MQSGKKEEIKKKNDADEERLRATEMTDCGNYEGRGWKIKWENENGEKKQSGRKAETI